MPLCVLGALVVYTCFADRVFVIGALVLFRIVYVFRIEASLGRPHFRVQRTDPDDPYCVWRACTVTLGGLSQQRRQQLCKEQVAKVVHPELELIALLCLGALRRMHHAGIVEENIQLGLSREKLLCRFRDGFQVGQIEGEEFEAAGRGGERGANRIDGFESLGLASGGNVDGGSFGVEDLGKFLANAGVGTGDDVDLTFHA